MSAFIACLSVCFEDFSADKVGTAFRCPITGILQSISLNICGHLKVRRNCTAVLPEMSVKSIAEISRKTLSKKTAEDKKQDRKTDPDYLSGWRDLNPRPLDPQSSALPNCATARLIT